MKHIMIWTFSDHNILVSYTLTSSWQYVLMLEHLVNKYEMILFAFYPQSSEQLYRDSLYASLEKYGGRNVDSTVSFFPKKLSKIERFGKSVNHVKDQLIAKDMKNKRGSGILFIDSIYANHILK